jgi:uncharacterized protein YjiS (DUF1127 family)
MTAAAAGTPAASSLLEEYPMNTIARRRFAADSRLANSMAAVAEWLHRAIARLHHRSSVAATRRSLGALDDRALRDLGVSRSEISSLAAELHGAIEPTRVHAQVRTTARSGS